MDKDSGAADSSVVSNPLTPTLDRDGNVRMRVPPMFLALVQDVLRDRGIDMALQPMPDNTAEILLRRLPDWIERRA